MKITQKQIEAVLALLGQERYEYFVKSVADCNEVWGLYADGWALAVTDDLKRGFPLWPAKEYAVLCAQGDWGGYVPEVIPMDDFMNTLLPMMERDNLAPCVFYTPADKGIVPTVQQLRDDIRRELENY